MSDKTRKPIVKDGKIYCPFCGAEDSLHASYVVGHGGQLFAENGEPQCYFFEDDTIEDPCCLCESCGQEVEFDGFDK